MAALDTNVLVRYLVADDRKQFEAARSFIEQAGREELFIPLSVAIELEWVLRTRYQLKKTTILSTFTRLLGTDEIWFQEEASIEVAVSLHTEMNSDFADCVHLAIAFTHVQTPLMTFDRRAAQMPGAQMLT